MRRAAGGLAVLAPFVMAAVAAAEETRAMTMIADFSDPRTVSEWRPVDDVVMGGMSRSRLEPAGGAAVFAGVVSLARGGGFASVRGPVEEGDLSACAGVEIRVRGDGRVYRLRLHDSGRLDGVAWQARFETQPGDWQVVRIGFDGLEASFRGRRVPGAPPLDTANLRQAGVMIAEKQAGPFRLEIAWIRAYGCAPGGGE